MKMKKRFIAILIVMIMVLSMIPAAYAAIVIPVNPPPTTGGSTSHTHNWDRWHTTKQATCTEEGERTCYCYDCGASYSEAVPALGHDLGDWYVVSEPTEDSPGEERRDCSRCDYYESRDIGGNSRVSSLDVSLTIVGTSAPLNGSYYTPNDNIAQMQYFLSNNSDVSIHNVSVYFFDMSEDPFALSYVMSPSELMSEHISYWMGPITKADTQYIYCSASFEDEQGNYYTVVSNNLAFPLGVDGEDNTNRRSSDLILQLSMPEIPACGFFTEGSLVHLNGLASAKLGDVYNADIGCGLNIYPFIGMDTTVPYSVDILISDLDCLCGYRDVQVFGCYYDENGDFCTTYSNMIRIPCGIYGVEDDRALSLSLLEVSVPDNYYDKTLQGLSPFYQEGETIWLQLLLCDPDASLTGSNKDLVSAELYMSSPESEKLTTVNCGSYIFGDYTGYTVTAEDVEKGYIDAYGFADVVFADFGACQMLSNSLMLPCGRENSVLAADLAVLSSPANGSYFVPGEQVWLVLYVTNNGDTTINNISVTDALMGEVGWIGSMPAGDVQLVEFVYTVTEQDAENGSVQEFCKANGNEASAVSNMVSIPCGTGTLTEQGVQVFKLLYPGCESANGMYFTEGESLSYYIIVTNCTDQPLYNIAVHDSRAVDYEATIEMLAPGESDTVSYFDTVNKDDVALGWALNSAAALWMDDGATYRVSTSNIVAVPAGAGNSVLSGGGGDDSFCRKTLIGKADGAYQYEQSLCQEHSAVTEEANQIFEGCDSFEAFGEAYKNIRLLWTDSLNDLYDEWVNAVSGEYYVAALKDKNAFFAMLEAYEKALPVRGIEDEMSVDVLVTELLRTKCLELCYELHSEPEPDPAGLTQDNIPDIEAIIAGSCSPVPDELAGSGYDFTEIFCNAHSPLLDGVIANVKNAKNESDAYRAWCYARTVAGAALNKSYAEMTADLDEESAALLLDDSAMLKAYLAQREETLKLYRSSEYSVLAEAYVRGIMYRLALNCMTQS